MTNNEIDFFAYGEKIANDMYANASKIAEDIGKKYGVDAKLEFEVGLSLKLGKQAFDSLDVINNHTKKTAINGTIRASKF